MGSSFLDDDRNDQIIHEEEDEQEDLDQDDVGQKKEEKIKIHNKNLLMDLVDEEAL